MPARRIALVTAALLLIATRAGAQAAPEADPVVQSGSRVRIISMDSLRVIGRVETINDERLLVQRGQGASVAVPIASIRSVEISRGYRSRAAKGALIGGLSTGAAVAVLVFAGTDPDDSEREEEALILGTLATLPGAAIGTLVGYLTSPERWVRAVVPGRR